MRHFFSCIFACAILLSCSSIQPIPKIPTIFKTAKQSFVRLEIKNQIQLCLMSVDGLVKECEDKIVTKVGSGTIIAHDRKKDTSIILTAAHLCGIVPDKTIVLSPALFVRAKNSWASGIARDIDGNSYPFQIISTEKSNDLCLIETEKRIPKNPIKIGYVPPEYGDIILNLSNVKNLAYKSVVPVAVGYFSGIRWDKYSKRYWSNYSLPADGGASGSMFLNENGELIGILTHGHKEYSYICFGPTHKVLIKFFSSSLKNRMFLTLTFQY